VGEKQIFNNKNFSTIITFVKMQKGEREREREREELEKVKKKEVKS
jgi:hypothetical protein